MTTDSFPKFIIQFQHCPKKYNASYVGNFEFSRSHIKKKMKRSRKISFHIFYLTPVHSSSLYVGGASFDIRSSHAGPLALELGNAVPLLLRNRTTADYNPTRTRRPSEPSGACLMTSRPCERRRLHYSPGGGGFTMSQPALPRGACYLAVPSGLLWRAIQQSGLSMNPWRWLFFYFLKQYFFFFFCYKEMLLFK